MNNIEHQPVALSSAPRTIDRRRFLRAVGMLVGSVAATSLLAACAPSPPPAATAAPAKPAAPPTTAAAAPPTGATASQPTQAAAGVAATSAPAKVAAEAKGLVTVAQPGEFLYLDPQVSFFSSEASVHYSIFDSVIRRGDDMQLVPSLATSWKAVSPTEWVLELRKDVKFHNGELFDAQAMKWNVERIMEPGANRSPYVPRMTAAEVVDASTIKITTKDPDPIFPGKMTMFFIVPPQYVQQTKDVLTTKPLGSGPYRFVERVKDSHLTMEANPDWWGGSPKIKTVTWKVLPDAATRVSALRAGEVDVISGVSPDQFDQLNADSKLAAMWKRSIRTPLVMTFPDSPDGGGEPLKNQSVRQALNYAVNVDGILKFLLNGLGERTATLMTPDFPFFDPSVTPYEYDPNKAKQLLNDAGYPNGFELNFDVPSTAITIKPVEVAQAIAGDLAKVGIKANVRPQEFATSIKLRDERKIAPLFLWSWGGAPLDADDKFFSIYARESPYTTFPVDAEIDRLVVEGRTTVDDVKRKTIYADLQSRVKAQAANIFLYAQPDVYAINKRLTWEARSDERIFLWNSDLKA